MVAHNINFYFDKIDSYISSCIYDMCYHLPLYNITVLAREFTTLSCITSLQFAGATVLITDAEDLTSYGTIHTISTTPLKYKKHCSIIDDKIWQRLLIAPADFYFRITEHTGKDIIVGNNKWTKGVELTDDPIDNVHKMIRAKLFINDNPEVTKYLYLAGALEIPILSVESSSIINVCGSNILYYKDTCPRLEQYTEGMLDGMCVLSKNNNMRLVIDDFKRYLQETCNSGTGTV